jgi:hypothetical protein
MPHSYSAAKSRILVAILARRLNTENVKAGGNKLYRQATIVLPGDGTDAANGDRVAIGKPVKGSVLKPASVDVSLTIQGDRNYPVRREHAAPQYLAPTGYGSVKGLPMRNLAFHQRLMHLPACAFAEVVPQKRRTFLHTNIDDLRV